MKKILPFLIAFAPIVDSQAQVTISIDFATKATPISPYIYGRNNATSLNASQPLTTAAWTQLNESGIRMLRENGGNNCTKYNWRKKLSSHPDWYNNVYDNNWDFSISSIKANAPQLSVMYGFQLLGKVASSKANNFNDWAYNQSQYWDGVAQNLAGGGIANSTGGGKATTVGNIDLYLKDWTADSTVSILDAWRNGSMAIPDKNIEFWNMDNEVDIWNGTHDDVVTTAMEGEVFIQKYIAVAKAARAKFPNIKLAGPVTANEWQWYNWQKTTSINGKNYCWMEFFIKRIAEEQAISGMKLLDVLDVHFYPSTKTNENALQVHRVFFDSTYVYPDANGVKTVNGGWDNTITNEKFFLRCQAWLKKYMGPDYGVTFGISESDIQITEPNVLATWYASNIGEFMRHPEMTLFTPWSWRVGMWETAHLFARYNQENYIKSTSSNETFVSAYPSINASLDSATIVLVNRHTTQEQTVNIKIEHDSLVNNTLEAKQLSNLGTSETFISHSKNALKTFTVEATNGSISLKLPALSTTSIQLLRKTNMLGLEDNDAKTNLFTAYPSPSNGQVTLSGYGENETIEVLNIDGVTLKKIVATGKNQQLSLEEYLPGVYILKKSGAGQSAKVKIVKM